MDGKNKGKGSSPTRSIPTRAARTRAAQQKKDEPIPPVVALPSRVGELCGNKKKQTSSRTAPTRTNPIRASNKKKIIACSDDDAAIKQDEIVEGVFSRSGLTRAALNNKKRAPSGWSDGESEGSHQDTIHQKSCAPTSGVTCSLIPSREREKLHAMLDNFIDGDTKRDASSVSAPTRANAYGSSHDESIVDVRQMRYASLNAMLDNFLDGDNKRDASAASPTRATRARTACASSTDGNSGDFGQIGYNPLHVKNVLLEALIDNFFSKHDVAAPTRATTGCAVPVNEEPWDDSEDETTPKRMAAAPTDNNPCPDAVTDDDPVQIVYSSVNIRKPVVNRKEAANSAAAARLKELLDTSDEEDVDLNSSRMSGTPTSYVGRRGLSLSAHMMRHAAHLPQMTRRGAAIRDDSESPTMAAAPTRKNARSSARIGAPTATTRRVAHREVFNVSPTRYASSSGESVDSATNNFISKFLAKDIIVDTDDEDRFARMFANRAAVTFGESP